jgi:hypothetical protein
MKAYKGMELELSIFLQENDRFHASAVSSPGKGPLLSIVQETGETQSLLRRDGNRTESVTVSSKSLY